jgi:hypothetical protein
MTIQPSAYVCAFCGVSVGYWHFGWKHQNGRNTGLKSCGKKPQPMLRTIYDQRQRDALNQALKG